ncbi:MAG: sigma-70 family RNA polymerase sigma factor [Acidimicrobiia bacterium]|nr:sigma-70 family RNA polymerase sigma factor [Acidimicrobiia bacterium]
MTDAATDIALIERYVAGDMTAFDQLVRLHQDRVFGICLRMLRSRDAALDATQDTFVTLLRKADRYRAEAAFSTWLYRVTVNVCYDHLRRRQRRATDQLPDHHDQPDPKAVEALESVELRPDVERALATLSDDFRAAVVLVDVQGLSLETAAQVLEVPVGTVKSRVFRGRRQLADQLGNLRPPPHHPTET